MAWNLGFLSRLPTMQGEFLRTPVFVLVVLAALLLAIVLGSSSSPAIVPIAYLVTAAILLVVFYIVFAHRDATRMDPRILMSDQYHLRRLSIVRGDDKFDKIIDLKAEQPVGNTAMAVTQGATSQAVIEEVQQSGKERAP